MQCARVRHGLPCWHVQRLDPVQPLVRQRLPGPRAYQHRSQERWQGLPAPKRGSQLQLAALPEGLHRDAVLRQVEHVHQVVWRRLPAALAHAHCAPLRRSEVPAQRRDAQVQHTRLPDPLPRGQWHSWSTCTASCGFGSHKRTRATVQPRLGGNACPHSAETRRCNVGDCPIHCSVNAFSAWTQCTKSCGTGSQVALAIDQVARTQQRRLRVPVPCGDTQLQQACMPQGLLCRCVGRLVPVHQVVRRWQPTPRTCAFAANERWQVVPA